MNTLINETAAVKEKNRMSSEAEFDRQFKPRGAFAFFLLLLLLSAITWYGIYLVMLSRT